MTRGCVLYYRGALKERGQSGDITTGVQFLTQGASKLVSSSVPAPAPSANASLAPQPVPDSLLPASASAPGPDPLPDPASGPTPDPSPDSSLDPFLDPSVDPSLLVGSGAPAGAPRATLSQSFGPSAAVTAIQDTANLLLLARPPPVPPASTQLPRSLPAVPPYPLRLYL